jgi:DNA repair exonuclease SbcCD ATPase subunit
VTWEEYKAQEEEIKKLREEIERYKPPVEEIQRRIAEIEARLKELEAERGMVRGLVEAELRRLRDERSRVEGELKGVLAFLEARGLKHVSREELEAEKKELRSLKRSLERLKSKYDEEVKRSWGHYSAKAMHAKDEAEKLRILLKFKRYATDEERKKMEEELAKCEEEYRKWSDLAGEYASEMRSLEREIDEVSREIDRRTEELKRKVVSPWVLEYQARLRDIDRRIEEAEVKGEERMRKIEEEASRLTAERMKMLEELRKPAPPPELVEKLRKLEEEHKKKKIYRKLVALHKRWQYESHRKGHDLMIEGIATVIIEGWEDEWEYKRKMNDAIWRAVDERFRGGYWEVGWEELKRIFSGQEETVGFQVKYTKLPPRDIIIEEIDWDHTIEKEKIGEKDGKPIYKKVPILSLKEATAKYPFVKIARIEGEET